MIYFNQKDYASVPYNKPNGTKKNLSTSGCGVVAACIAFDNLIGTTLYTPQTMAKFSIAHGARTNDGTNEGVLLKALCAANKGFSYKATNDVNALVKHLNSGGVAICNQGENYNVFSTDGHYVVAYKMDGDNIEVIDPQMYAGKYDAYNRPSRIVKKTEHGCIVKPIEMKKATQDRDPAYYLISYKGEKKMAKYIKILLIGNSYTYYNGYGEILSRLCYASKRNNVIVVRATKGGVSANDLIKDKLEYKAWLNGKVIKSGKGALAQINKIDFNSIGRAGKWDYIVLQNNATVAKTCQYDVEAFNYVKGWLPSAKDFIINATHFGKSESDAEKRLAEHKEAQKICKCQLINEWGIISKYSSVFSGQKWIDDLTIKDKPNYHQSARLAYLNALCTYAKIFGIGNFSKDGKTIGIPLYNADDKSAKGSLVTDNWHKGSTRGNSITKSVAAKLQYLVRKYASQYIGATETASTTTVKHTTHVAKPAVKYFPKYKGKSDSIVDALESLKYDSSFSYRKKIAAKNGIKGYTGLPFQNTKMLNLLKQGKLIKP